MTDLERCRYCRFCEKDLRGLGLAIEHHSYTDRCECNCPYKPNIQLWNFTGNPHHAR